MDPLCPRRQYTFRARKDRQRIAVRLGHGMPVRQVAAVERIEPHEVAKLLDVPSFAELVRHYEALAALPREERLARLEALAFEQLELALAGGDLRTLAFFYATRVNGQDFPKLLAEAALARIEAQAA